MPHAPGHEGARIHYRMQGVRGAPSLLLSNSLGTDLDMWSAQADVLGQSFCVVRYDSRGHGGSTAPPGPYTIAQMGHDVVALLDHLDIEAASFCGVSMGGMIGQWLGLNAPARIHRLVLANTAAKIGTPDMWNARIAKVDAEGMGGIAVAVVARWLTPEFAAREPATYARLLAMLESVPAAGYAACCAAVRDFDARDDVGAIAAPTLVIAGTHDAATPPADGHFLADRIAGAAYVELPAAHLSNIEAAPAFTAAVTDFLRQR